MCLKYGLKSKSGGKGETRYLNIINKAKNTNLKWDEVDFFPLLP